MRRFAVLLVIGVLGLVSFVGLAGGGSSVSANTAPKDWDPLSETCNDVTGDGKIDLANDILGVILRHGASWGDDNYALVFDNGAPAPRGADGTIDLANDILGTILDFDPFGEWGPVEYGGDGSKCNLLDTQVIRSAAALLRYQDCQDAANDGYGSTGVYVPDMGIHISKLSNLKSTFDPEAGWDGIDPETATDLANPFGLVCSVDQETGGVGKLIGPWYIIPVQSTGTLYGLTPPPGGWQPDNTPPVGFDTDADYVPYDESNGGVQAAWHKHINLCVGQGFLSEQGPGPWVLGDGHDPTDPVHRCTQHLGGSLNVPLYGWMLHLYNFVPNNDTASQQAGGADARFMRWNRNPDFPICEYDPVACGGGGGIAAEEPTHADGTFCPIDLGILLD